MKLTYVISALCLGLLLISLGSIASANLEEENTTLNLSLMENGSVQLNSTNQSMPVDIGANNTSVINASEPVASSGGIKNFMKSFSYQSQT